MKNKGLTNRAKQAIETKKRILNEGRKLILKKGYEEATVNEICKQANITVGTFYYYFKGKDELIQGMFPKIDDFNKLHENEEYKGAFQNITEYFAYFNQEVERTIDIGIVRQLFKSEGALAGLDEERIASGVEHIVEGQVRGEVDKSFHASYIAKIIFAATRGITLHWVMHQTTIELGRATVDVVERMVYSFLTPKGKKVADDYIENRRAHE